MCALMVQHGCDEALKMLPVDMEAGMKLVDHIDEFNKLILDLANIDIEIEDEDETLMLLMSLTSSYENLMETLLYGGTNNNGKAHSGRSSQFKSMGGTGKLKCFICHSESHYKGDCPMKKSSRFVSTGKHDQDYNDDDNAYFEEALMVLENYEMTELSQGDQRLSGYDDWDHEKEMFGFKQRGPGAETGVQGVQVDKRVWFGVELKGAQGNHEGEVGANMMVTEVRCQDGAEGNVAEKKKVKESIESSLGKLL
ncbi:retrovirus-related pol polyprotein from transposon TNT 1-94 [Tanacetum coccineum]